jgi:phosphatidylglycerol---prolipoprotein diacylglyceryl transferase
VKRKAANVRKMHWTARSDYFEYAWIMNTSSIATHWVHDLSPFLFQFPDALPWIGGFGIRYYGLAYVLGVLIGYLLLLGYWKKGRSPLNPDALADLVTVIVLGILIGGRLGYMLFYDFGRLLSDPLSSFYIWEGGMASHGGMMGVTIAILWFAHSRRLSILQIGDLIATVSAPGLFLGRIANFIKGELWGKPSEVSWAVIFPEAGYLPRHPSQLYQAVGEGLLLMLYMQLRFWNKLGRRPPHGQLAGEFLIGYSVARVVCEVFREPDASLILGLSRGQFYSIATLIGGVVLIVIARHLDAKTRIASHR